MEFNLCKHLYRKKIAMKTKLLSTIVILLSLALLACGQNRTIQGRVTSTGNKQPLAGARVQVKGTQISVQSGTDGMYKIEVPKGKSVLLFSAIGFNNKEVSIGLNSRIDVSLTINATGLQEEVVANELYAAPTRKESECKIMIRGKTKAAAGIAYSQSPVFNTEDYSPITENGFHLAGKEPLSTFSIDVDNASYSNIRRFLNQGQLPPKDAVRIEELINYFDYNYEGPTGKDPVAIHTEYTICPWNVEHKLVKIDLQAKRIPTANLIPSNLVFLIDVSGSMNQANKLPLVKSALKLLVDQLRPQDKVAIVVYAGAAGIVLAPTPGNQKGKIIRAIDELEAGGSTAGGEGIKLAYKTAAENLIKGENSRVILATDGDFNVGVSSDGELQRLIEEKRESGVFLSVLGFGMGNYKDNKLEILADKGNGNYAYIDNFNEAKKVFVNEFGGTLFTLAKDVKLQIEFNPTYISSYRLIGYENRILNNEDFNDDKKDAGEMGSGHTVTALYEIIQVGSKSKFIPSIDKLKYQNESKNDAANNELLTVKLRYKDPESKSSKLLQKALQNTETSISKTSENFRFTAAVAEFGLLLRDSELKANASFDHVLEIAKSAKGKDEEGYRAEFINLVRTAKLLKMGYRNPISEGEGK
jgi:Ca-activated chloride channel family protein